MAWFGPPSCVEESRPGILWAAPWYLNVFLMIILLLREEELESNMWFLLCSMEVQIINMGWGDLAYIVLVQVP